MKKIGILTFHRSSNFGSCLQAYGLVKKIQDLGYDCELIDYRCPAIEEREGLKRKERLSWKEIARQILYQPTINRKYKSLTSFLAEKVELSIPCGPDTISQTNKYYDCFLVGSDIVWGTDITQNDYNYFLEFADQDKKKLAFASSVGTYDLQDSEIKGNLLARFDRIAVRERGAVEWIHTVSGKEADWVCDPTMLLSAEEWDDIVKPKVYKSNYVLVYFTDDKGKCMQDAKAYAQKHGLKVYYINHGIQRMKGVQKMRPTSLKEFLGLLHNAQFVFTASYHGMLYAMYYHKPFQFYTRAHSDRVLALAEKLGVMENCGDNREMTQYKPVDYDQVEKRLQAFRTESVKILQEMLQL